MSNNKQSSVELFAKTLAEQGLLPIRDYKNLVAYQQAKAMHKEEIIVSWMATDNELQRIAAEQYYNETFGGNNE